MNEGLLERLRNPNYAHSATFAREYMTEAATEIERLSMLVEEAANVIHPFACFAKSHVDDEGWNGPMRQTRIVDWFGPSQMRAARTFLAKINGDEK